MKRFFGELSILMRKRKHLLFLIIIWSVMSLAMLAFHTGLGKTTENAFGTRPEGVVEYKYDLEIKNKQVISSDALSSRIKLNKMLSESEEFGYYAYYLISGTVSGLKNQGIAITSSGGTVTSDDPDVIISQNYTVPVLLLDKGACRKTAIPDRLLKMFEGDIDYDGIVPAMYGAMWMSEAQSLSAEGGYPVETGVRNYKLGLCGFVTNDNGNNLVSFGDNAVDLKNYIIIPLRDMGSSNSTNEGANDNDRRSYWCKIYDLRNQGVITSDMKPDSLQKRINELLELNKLTDSFSIRIQDADYDSKILYNENLSTIKLVVKDVSLGAIAITGMMLLLYLLFSVTRNQRYGFLARINGTGKFEFWLLHIFQLAIWFVFTVFPSYAVYLGLMRMMNISYMKLEFFMIPAAIMAGIAAFAVTLRILVWDTGKILRRV